LKDFRKSEGLFGSQQVNFLRLCEAVYEKKLMTGEIGAGVVGHLPQYTKYDTCSRR